MSRNDSLISIIVRVYNVEQYFSRCVNSLVNQTYHNIEIILVDDGRAERCGEMCDEYAKRDKRVVVTVSYTHLDVYKRQLLAR